MSRSMFRIRCEACGSAMTKSGECRRCGWRAPHYTKVRKPTVRETQVHRDKKRYTRKEKYRGDYES